MKVLCLLLLAAFTAANPEPSYILSQSPGYGGLGLGYGGLGYGRIVPAYGYGTGLGYGYKPGVRSGYGLGGYGLRGGYVPRYGYGW
ncbi:neuropeptide-like protein 31 [Macrobrachium rosenbergii]|uniref:neuropeptide-like protein 31 n=1 Tax=Macrobrachium rosenbergii TaxID=79674 RepID=UPI0034D564C5